MSVAGSGSMSSGLDVNMSGAGLGVRATHDLESTDDSYDQYRYKQNQ